MEVAILWAQGFGVGTRLSSGLPLGPGPGSGVRRGAGLAVGGVPRRGSSVVTWGWSVPVVFRAPASSSTTVHPSTGVSGTLRASGPALVGRAA